MPTYPLQFQDGNFSTPVAETRVPVPSFPFKDFEAPDLYARHIPRRFLGERGSSYQRISTRTSYTNYLTYSEDFSNVAWTISELTRTAAALANPWDGTATFSKFLETAASASHHITRNHTFTAVPHTLTALVAPGLSRSYVRLAVTDGVTTFIAFFNIVDGVVFGTPSNCTAAIKRYADGSCRVSITFTPIAVLGTFYVQPSTDGSTISYAGDITKGFYCGGVQIERASSAGPYIVTTSATRTVSVPDVDGLVNSTLLDADDFAFQTGETTITEESSAPGSFLRTYSRVPTTQYEPLSVNLVRPDIHDVVSSGSYGVSFPGIPGAFIFSARKSASISGTPDVPSNAEGATASAIPSATITLSRSTGADFTFATTDSVATIRSAINSNLSSSNANKVTISATEIVVVVGAGWGNFLGATAGGVAGVEVTTDENEAATSGVIRIRASNQLAGTDRTLSCTSHGGTAGKLVVGWNENKIAFTSRVLAAATHTFTIPLKDLPDGDAVVTHIQFADTSSTRVATGPVECSARRTTRFYLPGFTPDVANRADVPLFPSVTRDPVSWLAVLVAYIASPSEDTYAVDATADLAQYAGAILQKAVVEIQVKDAYQSLSVSA